MEAVYTLGLIGGAAGLLLLGVLAACVLQRRKRTSSSDWRFDGPETQEQLPTAAEMIAAAHARRQADPQRRSRKVQPLMMQRRGRGSKILPTDEVLT